MIQYFFKGIKNYFWKFVIIIREDNDYYILGSKMFIILCILNIAQIVSFSHFIQSTATIFYLILPIMLPFIWITSTIL